jgi:hypothetical protein
VLLLAIAGLLFRARARLILCWFLGAILLWYANSAWYCWWFGDAFGARAFLELSGLFGVGLALSFSWLWKRPWLVAALSVAAVLFNILLMVLYITHRIPRDGYLF